MLRHLGAKRTHRHNLQLASLLGLTAGFVNAAGFLGFSILTTNVTGHAALFAERIAMRDWTSTLVVAGWMLLFLAGAFISSLVVSRIGTDQRYSYVIPILAELLILLAVALEGRRYDGTTLSREVFAGSLLFAMGMQNALVTMVSGSVVRTTHLTGTFTDLGIELAQALDSKRMDKQLLRAKIRLRLVIIVFFMGGALGGAWTFQLMHFHCFFIPAMLLVIALAYDVLRIRIRQYYRQVRQATRKTAD